MVCSIYGLSSSSFLIYSNSFLLHQSRDPWSSSITIQPLQSVFMVRLTGNLIDGTEVDTGATVSIMSGATFATRFPQKEVNCHLKNIHWGIHESGNICAVWTTAITTVTTCDCWGWRVVATWPKLASSHPAELESHQGSKHTWVPNVLENFKDVFADELGMIQSVKAKLSVNESVQPKLFKPQPVPLAIIAAVECELDRLESEGVLEKVDFSKWAAPIVMLKRDGQVHQVHICSDYKVSQPCSRHWSAPSTMIWQVICHSSRIFFH